MRLIDADKLAYMVACNGDADFINKVTKLMAEAPTIDADRPKGEWIDEKDVRPPFDVKIYKCSACGIYADAILASMYKFCPNCGADMRGDDNE